MQILPGYAEDSSSLIYFDSILTSAGFSDESVFSVMLSSEKRALLTYCLLLDLSISSKCSFAENNSGALLVNDSYVFTDGGVFGIIMHAKGQMLVIAYDIGAKQAGYTLYNYGFSDSLMNTFAKSLGG